MAEDHRPHQTGDTENTSWPLEHPALAIDGEYYAIGYPESTDRQDLSHIASPPSYPRSPSPEPAYLKLREEFYAEEVHAIDRHSRSFSPEPTLVGSVSSSFSSPKLGGSTNPVYNARSLPASSDPTDFAKPPVASPIPQVGPIAMSRPVHPINNPSYQVRSSEGVNLTKTVAPNAEALQKPRGPTVDNAAAYAPSEAVECAKGSRNQKNLRRFGNVQRSMSMRGSKPRVTKVRMVSKTDSKSYFAVERTMYQWMYISTAILGNSLTFYAVSNPDLGLVRLSAISATLLSFLSMAVMYYAAIYAYRRRRALNMQAEASAFDDRFGPVAIVALIIAVFAIYQVLSLRNIFLDMNGQSFGLRASVN